MLISQTADDLATLKGQDLVAYKALLVAILGGSRIKVNRTEYPEGYDASLVSGDVGYIEAQWEDQDDASTLRRFGFEDRDAVIRAIHELDVEENS